MDLGLRYGLILLAFSVLAVGGSIESFGAEAAKHILEFEAPAGADGVAIAVRFAQFGGPTYETIVIVRAGRHVYDLRNRPGWHGELDQDRLRIMAPWAPGGIPANLRPPRLPDALDTLFGTQRLTPRLVNEVTRRSAFGRSLEEILLLAWLSLTLALLLGTRKLGRSALSGAAIVLVAAEIVSISDHTNIVWRLEERGLKIPLFSEVLGFADNAKGVIGGSSWGSIELPGVVGSMIHYRLAETRFVPMASSYPPEFMIRGRAGRGEVVIALPGFAYLQRREP